jgi:large subunit ribosomal protein L2
MGLKKYNPVTPGLRTRVSSSFEEITAKAPEKSLIAKQSKSGGRNNTGKMTMRYTGGGHKRKYRVIDFKRDKIDIPATVVSIEYDPNRTARIALLNFADGDKRYIIAPAGLEVGNTVLNGPKAPINPGNTLPIQDIPLGTFIYNVELRPGQGGKIARGAGTYAQLSAKDGKYAILRLPSGESRMILLTCMASIGSTSNGDHSLEVKGKAGRNRWLGIRPRTRGVVMNPVDHPMGGGEGRASGGHPRSRNGIPAKGFKTRSKKNPSSRYIISKRKK